MRRGSTHIKLLYQSSESGYRVVGQQRLAVVKLITLMNLTKMIVLTHAINLMKLGSIEANTWAINGQELQSRSSPLCCMRDSI